MGGLEKAVKDIIERLYNCEFNKKISVTHRNGFYTATLYLHGEEFGGLVLSTQCNSPKEFLRFVEKELKAKRLDRAEHGKLKIYANIDTQEGLR